MPRDSSGNYTLPDGNPVVGGTIIDSNWANPTMSDLGNEITNSLDRNGRGGMLVPFKNVDGDVSAPGITFTTEPTSGIYRAGVNDIRTSIGANDVTRWINDGASPNGEQQPFEIWTGNSWAKALYAGGPATTLPALSNDTFLQSANFAGDGFIDLIKANVSNQIEFGAASVVFISDVSINALLTIGDVVTPLAGSYLAVLGNNSGVVPPIGFGQAFTFNRSVTLGEAIFWNTWDGHTAGNASFQWNQLTGPGVFTELMTLSGDGSLTVVAGGTAVAKMRIGQTGTANAQLWLDGVNGDFIGADYALIEQRSTGELSMHTTASGGNFILSAGNNAGTPQLTIAASGNDVTVNLGNLNVPAGSIVLESVSAQNISIERTGGNAAFIHLGTGGNLAAITLRSLSNPNQIIQARNANMEFINNSITGMTMASTGFVTIGTASITANLNIASFDGNGATRGCLINSLGVISSSATTTNLTTLQTFINTNATVGSIQVSASITLFNTSSEPLLKTEFEEITDALDSIVEAHDAGAIGLAGFLSDPDNRYPMFNGQWIAENQPNTGGSARTEDDHAAMDYGKRTPIHEAAIYELLSRVKHLEGQFVL